jgi:hypothetical protein
VGYYGRGDYYRGDCNYGDYYRGDPGIFGFLGKAVSGIARTAVAGLTGGPGAALKQIGTEVRALTTPAPARIVTGMAPGEAGGYLAPGPVGQIPQQPVGTMLASGFIPGCQLKGTRPNKSGYYKQVVKGNPANVVYIPKGSVCVKSRRLNVANPRALRRAIRRARGFAKLARRVMTFVNAKAPKGRAKFKSKK